MKSFANFGTLPVNFLYAYVSLYIIHVYVPCEDLELQF